MTKLRTPRLWCWLRTGHVPDWTRTRTVEVIRSRTWEFGAITEVWCTGCERFVPPGLRAM